MESLFQPILANPIYVPPTEYAHPAFSPMAISAMEGLLMGIVIWRWTHSKPAIILFGFLINLVTLVLFWAAIRREEHIWEYDYRVVAIGEIFVVFVEALAIVAVVRRFAARSPRWIWWKAFGVSLVLNALSFFAGAYLAYSPIPEKTSLLTPAPPPVLTVMTYPPSTRSRSLTPGQAWEDLSFCTNMKHPAIIAVALCVLGCERKGTESGAPSSSLAQQAKDRFEISNTYLDDIKRRGGIILVDAMIQPSERIVVPPASSVTRIGLCVDRKASYAQDHGFVSLTGSNGAMLAGDGLSESENLDGSPVTADFVLMNEGCNSRRAIVYAMQAEPQR